MRKDYETILAESVHQDESAFVEHYWTEKWKNLAKAPKLEDVVRRPEYRLMAPYLRKLPAKSRILDGGCGLGEWTVQLTQEGFDVIGLDLSRRTIELLQKQLPAHHFASGDIRHTGFADNSFDAYYSWGVFEHFENGLGECISEAHRIVKPGGLLFISVPFHNWRHMIRDARIKGQKPNGEAFRFYQWRLTQRELQNELEIRGFDVHRVKPIHQLSGAERMIHGLTGWGWNAAWPRWRKALYRGSQYAVSTVLPPSYLSHMVMAIAVRRP